MLYYLIATIPRRVKHYTSFETEYYRVWYKFYSNPPHKIGVKWRCWGVIDLLPNLFNLKS